MSTPFHIEPDWKWGTAQGSREFDRLLDRSLSFREKLEWLEEAETLTLQLRASREAARQRTDAADPPPPDQGNPPASS